MNKPTSLEPSPDSIIQDLHRIREAMVEEYGGDLHALTAAMRKKQAESGRPVWRGNQPSTPAESESPEPPQAPSTAE